jgi:hypothetical protein
MYIHTQYKESSWAWRDSSSQFHPYPPTTGSAPFPHGTCALSVSETYVSLGGKHHLIHSTVPTTATHRSQTGALPATRAFTGSAGLHRPSTGRGALGTPQLSPSAPKSRSRFSVRTGPFARRYSARRVCFRFLPLLICLSSGSNPSQASAPSPDSETQKEGERRTPETARLRRQLRHSATGGSQFRWSPPLFALCCGLHRSPSRRIHRPENGREHG